MSIGIRRSSTYTAVRPVAQHVSPTGSLVVTEPVPGVVRTMATGRLDAPMFHAYQRVVDARSKRGLGTLHAHDWEALTAYDFDVRVEFARWLAESAALTTAVLVLARSPLVTMAMTTASMATSARGLSLRCVGDRAEFERLVEAAQRSGQRSSEPPRALEER